MKRSHNIFTVIAAFFFCGIIPAQTSINELAGNFSRELTRRSIDAELLRIYEDVLQNPRTVNIVLKDSFQKAKAANLFSGLALNFKTAQSDKNTHLGISYTYDKSVKSVYLQEKSASKSGYNLSIAASGNISLEKGYNPDDFLKSSLAFGYFNSSGGAVEMRDEVNAGLTGVQIELSKMSREELDESALWKEYLAFVTEYLTTQIYFDLSLKGSIESNQDFTSRQYAYGAQFGFDLKAWNRNSMLAKMNVPDWPFALIRLLAGCNEKFTPRGSAIPTVLIDLSLVDPKNDKERLSLNGAGKYTRFGAEISFKTFIGRAGEKDLFFSADLRYYKEINPPAAVQKSGIDEFIYFTAALMHKEGLFFSYSTGSLPLDKKKDEVYSIGFQLKF